VKKKTYGGRSGWAQKEKESNEFNQGRKMTKKIKKYEYGKKIKNF
jgi:hypothetical protein